MSPMRLRTLVAPLLLLLCLSPLSAKESDAIGGPGPAPRFDAWHVVGPGGGGGRFLSYHQPPRPKSNP